MRTVVFNGYGVRSSVYIHRMQISEADPCADSRSYAVIDLFIQKQPQKMRENMIRNLESTGRITCIGFQPMRSGNEYRIWG